MRRYGVWAGNEKGTPERPERCIAEVWPRDGWIPYQCTLGRGHGPDGLYCKRHGKMAACGRRVAPAEAPQDAADAAREGA